MRGNAKTSDAGGERRRKAVRAASAKRKAETAEHRARLMEIGRRYTLHVRVTDPKRNEVLNLAKLTLGRDLHCKGNLTPNIRDVLELLVEAAEEHVLPFE